MRVAAWIPGVGSSVTVRVVDEHGKPIKEVSLKWSEKQQFYQIAAYLEGVMAGNRPKQP